MCGIFCSIICNKRKSLYCEDVCAESYMLEEYQELLSRRGPDIFCKYSAEIPPDITLNFAASVLWMQGTTLNSQPFVDNNGNVLLWNGDIFSGILESSNDLSDTSILSGHLAECSSTEQVLEVLSHVRGPFSFVYWHAELQHLWFGRDRIGRHSLLWQSHLDGSMVLSSVTRKQMVGFTEVPAVGIFLVDLNNTDGVKSIDLYPWSDIHETHEIIKQFSQDIKIAKETILSPIHLPNSCLFEEEYCSVSERLNELVQGCVSTPEVMQRLLTDFSIKKRVDDFIDVLKRSMRVRASKNPNICKICLKSYLLHSCKHCISRSTLKCVEHVQSSSKVCHIKVKHQCKEQISSVPISKSNDEETASIRSNIVNEKCGHSNIGILFSGGLDSAILAVLAHHFVPEEQSLDLLNVAFEHHKQTKSNPQMRKEKRQSEEEGLSEFDVPDRKTGRQTLQELRQLFPQRQWNFVEINVTQEELGKERTRRIGDLVYPLNTVLDDSLGCALWFACRGVGVISGEKGEGVTYVSQARVLLVGMGADEQLGGYMRHRTTLRHRGWAALAQELQTDLSRISSRNLGRDDRILSDHGRQGRYPYLDEEVVSFLVSLPAWHRCMPISSLPPGVGDKLLLRLVAWKLGLHKAANLPKRAFQFGSRIANSKEKASNISDRL